MKYDLEYRIKRCEERMQSSTDAIERDFFYVSLIDLRSRKTLEDKGLGVYHGKDRLG